MFYIGKWVAIQMNCIIRVSKDKLVKCLRNVTAHRAITAREFAFKCSNYDIAIFEIGDTDAIRDIDVKGKNIYVVTNLDIKIDGLRVFKPEELANAIYQDTGVIVCDGEIEDKRIIYENTENNKEESTQTEQIAKSAEEEKTEQIEEKTEKVEEKKEIPVVEEKTVEEEQIKEEAAIEQSNVQIESIKEELDTSRKEYERIAEEYKTASEKVEKSDIELEELRKQIDELRNNNSELSEDNNRLKKLIEEEKRNKAETAEKNSAEIADKDSRYSEIEAKLVEINQKYSDAEGRIESLISNKEEFEKENEGLKALVEEAKEREETSATENEGKVSKEEFERVQQEKNNALEQIKIAREEREGQIQSMETELSGLKEDKVRMMGIISDFENVKLGIRDKCDKEKEEAVAEKQREIDKKIDNINRLIERCNTYMRVIEVAINRYDEISEYVKTVELKVTETEGRLNDANNAVVRASGEISELTSKYDESLRDKLDNIKSLTEQIEEFKKNIEERDSKVKELEEELEKLQTENSELAEKAKSTDESTVGMMLTSLKGENESLRKANKRLKEQYDSLKNAMITDTPSNENSTFSAMNRKIVLNDDNDTEEQKIENRNNVTITRLNERIKELSKDNAELKKIIDSTIGKETITKPKSLIRNYLGEAKIVAVQSTSTCGATTLGMSIITELAKAGKKSIYIDLNTVSPDADGWFETDPVCDVDIVGGFECKTALGAIYKNGVNYFRLNRDKLTKEVSKNIDYLGGLYVSVSGKDLIGIKYDELFNYIGNMYDYVIVDLGRIGGSAEMQSVAKSVIDISKAYFLVSMNDSVAIRNAMFKLEECGETGKVNWIIRSNSKALVRNAQKILGNSTSTILPEVEQMAKGRRKYQDIKSREVAAILQNIMRII